MTIKEWIVLEDEFVQVDSAEQGPWCIYGGGHFLTVGDKAGIARYGKGELFGCVPHLTEVLSGFREEAKPLPAAATHEHDLSAVETVDGYKCVDCGVVFLAEEYDVFTLRQCSNAQCEQTFVATDGNSCPECNRPFSRKLADVACEDCSEAGENGCQSVGVKTCPECAENVEADLPPPPPPTKGKCQYCGKVKRRDLRGHIERRHWREEKARKEETSVN